MTALSVVDVAARVAETLPQWTVTDNALQRVYTCQKYLDALALVSAVGHLAEAADHHPDMALNYTKLTIRFWTHTAKGITALDFQLAEQVEALINELSGA